MCKMCRSACEEGREDIVIRIKDTQHLYKYSIFTSHIISCTIVVLVKQPVMRVVMMQRAEGQSSCGGE